MDLDRLIQILEEKKKAGYRCMGESFVVSIMLLKSKIEKMKSG